MIRGIIRIVIEFKINLRASHFITKPIVGGIPPNDKSIIIKVKLVSNLFFFLKWEKSIR